MRRGQIGLKAQDFIEALETASDAGAIVSFAGAPQLAAGDTARLGTKHPPVLVVATASLGNVAGSWADPVQMASLMEANIIQVAIIDTEEPARPTGKVDPAHEVFAQHYRILRRTE
jgi:hypothetical protein